MEHQSNIAPLEGSGADLEPVSNDEGESPLLTAPLDTPPPLPLSETHERAGFWLRLIAFLIDAGILTMFAFALLLIGVLVTNVGDEVGDLLADTADESPLFSLWISGVLTASAAYFTILHSEYGQTIGKSLLRLEVRTQNGALPSYSQALFRWLAYGLSIGFCGLGFLWVAVNPKKRGWHDLLAHTVVVTPKH